MRVWVDAQLPPALARALTQECGVDAKHVFQLGMAEAEDRFVFLEARRAADVIVTKDADFVTLVNRLGPPPRILWVTLGNTTNDVLISTLTDRWTTAKRHFAAGEALVEIGERQGP